MTREDCLAAFAAADTPPAAALRAALPFAAELVPDVTALLARAAADEPLLLEEERQAACGLAVLAAARRTEAFPALARMLAESKMMWPCVLGGKAERLLPSHITALYDDGATPLDAVYDRLEEELTPSDLRAALFLAFAWLVAAGRADRARLADALGRFAETVDLYDPSWSAWFPAAQALGLDAQVELNRQRHLDAIAEEEADEEQAEAWRAVLERANEPEALDAAAPIDDPALPFPPAPPTAVSLPGLSPSEEAWLDWQLLTLSVTGAAMPLESVDGYFTALHICPDEPPLAGNEAPIWGGATAHERLLRPEVAAAAQTLLARYFAAGRAELARGLAPEPFLEMQDDELIEGVLWGFGFVTGMERAQASWEQLMRRPAVYELVHPVLLLAEDEDDLDSPEEEEARFILCSEIIAELPVTMQRLRQVVRETILRPDRSVGRNDPCPCGSGKKYKKCCGTPGAVR